MIGIAASTSRLDSLRDLLAELATLPHASLIIGWNDGNTSPPLDRVEAAGEAVVTAAEDGDLLRPGRIYVVPPDSMCALKGNHLQVRSRKRSSGRGTSPIDHLLRSIAHSAEKRSIGIEISGGGAQSVLGLQAITDAGGITMALAQTDPAPDSALANGGVDYVDDAAGLAQRLQELVAGTRQKDPLRPEPDGEALKASIREICQVLKEQTDHDFLHYKTSTLSRRIHRRMQVLRVASPDSYIDHLRADPAESQALFRELLIGVTGFFRDPGAFAALAGTVIGPLVEARGKNEALRIWVAGCGTGEEAYSIAMLVLEALEGVANPPSVRLFATDIDGRALAVARRGIYPTSIAEQVGTERLGKFFDRVGRRYQIKKDVRERCLFSLHSLINDPPFSRVDLVSCRNVMIYFGTHLQKKLVPMFHYALRPGGYLFLGSSENFGLYSDLFRTVDTKARIAQRKPSHLAPIEGVSLQPRKEMGVSWHQPSRPQDAELSAICQRIVLDEFAPSYAIVDEEGQVVFLAPHADRYLQPPSGHFTNNVVRMARPGLRSALRSLWTKAVRNRRTMSREEIPFEAPEGKKRVRLTIQPMPELGHDHGLYLVVFQDQGDMMKEVRGDGASAEAEFQIDQLESELARTREELERTVQDLESANEELKSSNEELLSINEELQSANEELETSKEEIQFANSALANANNDLRNLLRSMQLATIFLDSQGRIRSFTPVTSELYNVTPADVGRPFGHFTHRFLHLPPLPDGGELAVGAVIEDEVCHQDGRWFLRRVVAYESGAREFGGCIVTYIDISSQKRMQSRLAEAERQVQAQLAELDTVYRSAPVGLALLDCDLRFLRINDALAAINGVPASEHQGKTAFEVVPELAEQAEPILRRVLDGGASVGPLELKATRPGSDGKEQIWLEVFYVPVRDASGNVTGISAAAQDITLRKSAEASVRESRSRLTKVLDGLATFAGLLELDGTLIEANETALQPAGLRREEVIGKKFWDTYWWSYDSDVQSRLKLAIDRARKGEFVRYDVSVRVGDHRFITIDFQLSPLSDESGRITHLVPSAVDITERKRVEHALSVREARYRTLFEHASVGIAKVGLDGSWIRVNQRLCEILGYTQEELFSLTFTAVTYPPDRNAGIDALRRLRAGEIQNYAVEKRYVRKDGSIVWCNLSTALHRDENGRPEFLVSVVEDVEDRKRAEDTQVLLIDELNHRVRNTLTVVKSIAAQTRRHSDTLDSFGTAFDGRIQALAATHTLLAESRWQAFQLQGLIEQQVRTHADRPAAINISGPAVPIGPKPALSLSLVFHELATNAAKYGALTSESGRIDVSWKIASGEGGQSVHLVWRETGGPPVVPPGRVGFGSKLIEFNITHEFEGRVRRNYLPEGLVCELDIPMPKSVPTRYR